MPQLDYSTYAIQLGVLVLLFIVYTVLVRWGIHRMVRGRVVRQLLGQNKALRLLETRLLRPFRRRRRRSLFLTQYVVDGSKKQVCRLMCAWWPAVAFDIADEGFAVVYALEQRLQGQNALLAWIHGNGV